MNPVLPCPHPSRATRSGVRPSLLLAALLLGSGASAAHATKVPVCPSQELAVLQAVAQLADAEFSGVNFGLEQAAQRCQSAAATCCHKPSTGQSKRPRLAEHDPVPSRADKRS